MPYKLRVRDFVKRYKKGEREEAKYLPSLE